MVAVYRLSLIALTLFLAACSTRPENLEYCDKALGAQDAGGYDLAVDFYTRCINSGDLSPTNQATTYTNRVFAYAKQGQYERAIADYNHALRIDPGDAITYNNRGTVYAETGDIEKAIQDYSAAIRLDPAYVSPYNNRGTAFAETGDIEQAIQDYDAAIRLDLSDATAYTNRGVAYRYNGEISRAFQDFDTAIGLDPGYVAAYNSRGNAYRDSGDNNLAMQDYGAAIRLNPDYALAHTNRALLYFYQGRFQEAVPDLETAVANDPYYQFSVIWLYLAQSRVGRDGRADLRRNAARLDLDEWPGPAIRMFLGELNPQAVYDMGQANQTRKDKERRAEAWFYVGQHHLMAGHRDTAKGLFEQVVATGITSFMEYRGAQAELRRF